ncbi:hypothetical protein F4560_003332 [Saccharothrix ecbatanensis]|uniref:Uncharacterized protein n=1 Tax=Saccharothrix ecbatanensis TaxID=1105145 RepID=A0A7W9M135_9PSEU|nr:hypothetical protein [Saccharothrix ecbatanensis]MBB5803564.1 hypothetical protein [Saccharothrix ecbatanensis]
MTRFTELGYMIIETRHDLPDDVAALEELCDDEDTTPLDPAGHTDCPGRAVQVWVDRSLRVDVMHFCVEFTEYGHRTISSAMIAAVEARLRDAGVPMCSTAWPRAWRELASKASRSSGQQRRTDRLMTCHAPLGA